MTAINKCLITEEPIKELKEFNGGFEYEIIYNKVKHKLRFSNAPNWPEVIKGNTKLCYLRIL